MYYIILYWVKSHGKPGRSMVGNRFERELYSLIKKLNRNSNFQNFLL